MQRARRDDAFEVLERRPGRSTAGRAGNRRRGALDLLVRRPFAVAPQRRARRLHPRRHVLLRERRLRAHQRDTRQRRCLREKHPPMQEAPAGDDFESQRHTRASIRLAARLTVFSPRIVPERMSELRIEPSGSKDFGACDCCGGHSRTVWGYAHGPAGTVAVYYVQWTLGQVDRHGAHFDLIIGNWDGADRSERSSISLEFRRTDQGPSFMVIDSQGRPAASNSLVGKSLSREEVIGTPLAQVAFDVVDAIWLGDDRISEIAGT